MTTKIKASMADADLATQAELDAAIAAEVAARNDAITAGNVKLAGDTVQVVNSQTGALATGTTTLPNDDTVPQITEGNEYMTATITPTSATSVLLIEVVGHFATSVAQNFTAALFQDAAANALAASQQFFASTGSIYNMKFTHRMLAGTTSATTFRLRAGGNNAGTTTFNGAGGARQLGGAMASSITITEIKA